MKHSFITLTLTLTLTLLSLTFSSSWAQVVQIVQPPVPLLQQPTQLPVAVQNLLNAPPSLVNNNPQAVDPLAPPQPTQLTVHVVTDTTDSRAPNAPPTPPGTTSQPYQAVPLDNAQNLQIFQAAPLLNAPGNTGAVVTSAATLSTPNWVDPLINRQSTAPESLGYVAVGTRDGVRIVGEDSCGCLGDSDPCDNPCAQQRTPGDEIEEALDRVKSAIAQQSGQIQTDHNWIESVRTIMRHYEKKISAVQDDSNRVKENIQKLFAKKKRYEDMLLRIRMDEEKQASNPNPQQIGKPGEVYSPVVTTCSHPQNQC